MIEESVRQRLVELLNQASGFTYTQEIFFPNEHARHNHFRTRQAQAGGWLASALALVRAVLPDPEAPHRKFIEGVARSGVSGDYHTQVAQVAQVLGVLEHDLKHGLFRSIANTAVALAFDDLLDHAEGYLKAGRIDVAGVIAGVAFEDSMRRVRGQKNIQPDDISIEDLVSAFAKDKTLTAIEARRARAAAAVRTSATHARWAEFSQNDVEACIHFTRQFISATQK